MKQTFTYMILVSLVLAASSCKKDWLDAKSDISLIVPTTLSDMRLLLNDEDTFVNTYTSLLEVSSDNYNISATDFPAQYYVERNAFTWQKDIYGSETAEYQWDSSYKQVFTANIILEGLDKIPVSAANQAEWNDIKGGALFHRAFAFYNLLQAYAPQYNAKTAAIDLGIPIRTKSDITIKTTRATVAESYNRVISDLTEALTLLKIVPTYKSDGSKPAAEGLLARLYLQTGDYDKAYDHANAALTNYTTLMDYNTLNPAASRPFARFNSETIFFSLSSPSGFYTSGFIDPVLYGSYADNDLRKSLYFKSKGDGTYIVKGNYTASSTSFCGIATDELYLIRAECSARKGNTADALNDLNTLMVTRFKTGTFVPFTAAHANDALAIILAERRKELVNRTLRWHDLRRLNTESHFALTLTRTVGSQTYTLPPNDPRYVFPIPGYVITLSGIPQNLR